jgi:hypothetical protein
MAKILDRYVKWLPACLCLLWLCLLRPQSSSLLTWVLLKVFIYHILRLERLSNLATERSGLCFCRELNEWLHNYAGCWRQNLEASAGRLGNCEVWGIFTHFLGVASCLWTKRFSPSEIRHQCGSKTKNRRSKLCSQKCDIECDSQLQGEGYFLHSC